MCESTKKNTHHSRDGEKVYYRYYTIMDTRVCVVAGYRAFSAFILLRYEKALGVFFLFFVSLCLSLFFEKNSTFRKYRVSRQRIAKKKFCTFGNGRLAKCAATKYIGLTCDGKIPPNVQRALCLRV